MEAGQVPAPFLEAGERRGVWSWKVQSVLVDTAVVVVCVGVAVVVGRLNVFHLTDCEVFFWLYFHMLPVDRQTGCRGKSASARTIKFGYFRNFGDLFCIYSPGTYVHV